MRTIPATTRGKPLLMTIDGKKGSRSRPARREPSDHTQGGVYMRRLLCGFMLAFVLASSTGCLLPIYSGDPVRRTQQLLFTSDNMRMILEEWERIWFLDQPDHMTPYRVHGGLL